MDSPSLRGFLLRRTFGGPASVPGWWVSAYHNSSAATVALSGTFERSRYAQRITKFTSLAKPSGGYLEFKHFRPDENRLVSIRQEECITPNPKPGAG